MTCIREVAAYQDNAVSNAVDVEVVKRIELPCTERYARWLAYHNFLWVLSHVWIFRWIPVHQTIAFPEKHKLQSQSKYPKLRKNLSVNTGIILFRD